MLELQKLCSFVKPSELVWLGSGDRALQTSVDTSGGAKLGSTDKPSQPLEDDWFSAQVQAVDGHLGLLIRSAS